MTAPPGTIERIKEKPPGQLLLDLENPRFGLSDAVDQHEALQLLAQRANLKELWDSIIQRGFESYEPMVGFETAEGSDLYIVVEGNRRLAAIKTLLQPELLQSLKVPSPPELPAWVRPTLETVPIYVVAHREDADDYIGFKHINGPQTWGSLAKAKFAVKLFTATDVAPGQEDTRVQLLSKRLGDSRQLILRNLVAYKIFEQARDSGFLDEAEVEENSLNFSHLYTMLQNPSTRAYLGLPESPLNEASVVPNPVPASNLEKLRYMMGWLFGSEEQESVIQRQGTDRPKLQSVLASARATETLEKTGDFDRAVEEAGFGVSNWFDSTVRLEALSKRVADGVTDLPDELEADSLAKAKGRLTASERNVTGCLLLLERFHPGPPPPPVKKGDG